MTLAFIPTLIICQDNCKCFQDKIQLCYTRSSDYCETSSSICGYSFDGNQMQNALRRKLLNPDLFGPDGIQDCSININSLPKNPSYADIVESGCKMIFIGNHGVSSGTLESQSEVSDASLQTIYDWSLECESNLVIATQAEAIPWGYRVDNVNQNPNSASGGTNPVFNGPFGDVSNYNQGGTFQANFVSFPSTDFEIIGQDNNGRATIIWDLKSNDILLADVGILCSGAGDISFGQNINNNNDRLACNIFAFGCSIADNRIFNFQNINLCDGDLFTLPNNDIVDQATTYIDTLVSSNNCDSFVVYNIETGISTEHFIEETFCQSDNESLTIEGITYDIDNTQGQAVIVNSMGCDSFININLEYILSDSSIIQETICVDDIFQFDGLSYKPDGIYEVVYKNTMGCDSVITLDITSYPEITKESVNTQSIDQFEASQIIVPFINNASINWDTEAALTCLDCYEPQFIPGISYPDSLYYTITDNNGCTYRNAIDLQYDCKPIIPNVFNPRSITGNENFTFNTDCPINKFELSIFDRWGSVVFQSNNSSESWNGRINGQLVPMGAYVYNLSYQTNRGEQELTAGTVTVLY